MRYSPLASTYFEAYDLLPKYRVRSPLVWRTHRMRKHFFGPYAKKKLHRTYRRKCRQQLRKEL